jgi:hypothetical protein
MSEPTNAKKNKTAIRIPRTKFLVVLLVDRESLVCKAHGGFSSLLRFVMPRAAVNEGGSSIVDF